MEKLTNKHLLFFTITLLLVALFSSLNVLELRAMEPIRALVTMEMLINNDFVCTTMTGEAYLHKPPFFNWYMGAFLELFSDWSEWAIRFPSIFAYLLTGLAMFYLLKSEIGERTAGAAAVFFLFGADLLYYGTVNGGEMDLFLPLPVFFQIIILPYLYKRRKLLLMFLLSYFFMYVFFLTKHFAAFAIQGVAVLSLMISERNWKILFGWRHILGGLFFLSLVAGYFYLYSTQCDLEVFVANLFLETTDKSHSGNISSRFVQLVTVPLTIIKLLLPWSLLVFFLFKDRGWRRLMGNHIVRYCFIFSILNIGLYWLIGEPHDRYLYPLFPFFSIVLASAFDKFTQFNFRTVLWVAIIMGIARIGYNVFILPIQQEKYVHRDQTYELLEIASGEQILLTGWEVSRKMDENYYGQKIIDVEVKYPAPIPYVIPYIITRETGKIVQFQSNPEPGKLYLAPSPFVKNKKVEILYTVPVDYIEGGLLLCRFK